MSYPEAFCVKCQSHTRLKKAHTVVLQNSRRALKGNCPSCESEVFKILAKKATFDTGRLQLFAYGLASVAVVILGWTLFSHL